MADKDGVVIGVPGYTNASLPFPHFSYKNPNPPPDPFFGKSKVEN